MKIAGFVNPLVHARGPCFNYVWVEALPRLLQPLHREARCECMQITGGWFKDWARQNDKTDRLGGLRTIWVDELLLYRRIRALGELPTALDSTAYQAEDGDHPPRHRQWRATSVSGVRLLTRNGKDWTRRFPTIVDASAGLRARSCLLGGEAVCCDENGLAVFVLLRYRSGRPRSSSTPSTSSPSVRFDNVTARLNPMGQT